MFGAPGKAYVYFTYGMHYCMNAVTSAPGHASAVLLRALEPVWGLEEMRAAGGPPSLPGHKLASGPGRLCRALGIGRELNGTDLVRGPVRIRRGPAPSAVQSGVRIGLRADDVRPWRFWTPSPSLSR
jgi:DNA-3-methyladenine glycosylase